MDPTTGEPAEHPRDGAPPVLAGRFRAQLKEVGLEGLVEEAFRMFVRNAPERIERVRRALATGSPVETAAGAHALKSASLNIWALGLARLLDEVESAGEASDLERASGALAAVERELERVVSFLSAELAKGV